MHVGTAYDRLQDGQLGFRVHGPSTGEFDGQVRAVVFARKLRAMIDVLHAADVIANGRKAHIYTIAKLHSSDPTVVLAERLGSQENMDGFGQVRSGIPTFSQQLEYVVTGNRKGASPIILDPMIKLAKGRPSEFGFAEFWAPKADPIRVDEFILKQARAMQKSEHKDDTRWYSGVALGEFDGTLSVADSRGASIVGKLTLTGGAAVIDYVCPRAMIEKVRENFDRRVRIRGRAIYSGDSGLPQRIEMVDLDPVIGGDIERWKGKIRPFEIEPWEYES